jgi:thiol-disulfide isomerase/thioredoxin
MRLRNEKGRFKASPPMDVREPSQIKEAEALIQRGPKAVILVYADWCGHCQTYKPMWKEMVNRPERNVQVLSVKEDVFPQMKMIKDAKIQGYPSVIEVSPTGEMREFKVPGSTESTNAVPYMRDEGKMKEVLTEATDSPSPMNRPTRTQTPPTPHRKPSQAPGFFKTIRNSLNAARKRLFGAKSYKAPKNHRGGTRKNRTRRH